MSTGSLVCAAGAWETMPRGARLVRKLPHVAIELATAHDPEPSTTPLRKPA
jgi:hypothetical protein